MSSIFKETYQFDSYEYELVDAGVGPVSIQQAYDDELRTMGFRLDESVDGDYISSWSRSRFLGMEGEQVVLTWESEPDDAQTYLTHLGINR